MPLRETTPTETHTHTGADAPTADKTSRNPGKTEVLSTEAPKTEGFVNGSEWIEIVDKIDHAGGRITIVGDRLRVAAPAGTLTDQDRAVLARHRDGLVEALTPRSRSTPRSTPRSTEDQAVQDDHRRIVPDWQWQVQVPRWDHFYRIESALAERPVSEAYTLCAEQ